MTAIENKIAIEYEPVVGMECHAELLTESKMFCGCENKFGGEPNTRCCPVCLGMPGRLPVMNKKAVEHVMRTALALNCTINPNAKFDRKNYFYPDLPKGYQISEYDFPIGVNGWLDVEVNGETKRIHIRRVHLEEDTGKLFHVAGNDSYVDLNRSGVPLMEIVTEFPPDIHSADEARAYLTKLRAILTYIEVCDGKMEEGSLRCEPNVSIRPKGSDTFGTKTEIKNLNSFRAVQKGIEYEVERQAEAAGAGRTDRAGDAGLERREAGDVLAAQQGSGAGVPLLPRTRSGAAAYHAGMDRSRFARPCRNCPMSRKARFMSEFGLPAARRRMADGLAPAGRLFRGSRYSAAATRKPPPTG